MRFKTDENLPASVVNVLRDAGHDVDTVVDERLAGASDDVALAAATQEQRAFLTLDKDFADIRAYPPADYAGIVACVQVTRLRRIFAQWSIVCCRSSRVAR